eukprot:3662198-Amphidinium_carterae.2
MEPTRLALEVAEKEWETRLQSLKQRQVKRQRHSWTIYIYIYMREQHPARLGKQLLRSDYPPHIAGLWHEERIVMQPDEVHAIMNSTWGNYWDSDLRRLAASEARTSTPHSSRVKMKRKKAPGLDQLRNDDLLRLPPVLFEAIAAFWTRCEETRTWPDALQAQHVVYLPKSAHAGAVPAADQLRPIVLLPHILKAWSVHRQHYLRDAVQQYEHLLGGRPKVRVQRELAKLLLQLQAAVSTNQVVSGAHLDLTKAFELIPHSLMRYTLDKLGLPAAMTTLMLQQYVAPEFLTTRGATSSHGPIVCGIAAGCPLAIYCMSAITIPLSLALRAQNIQHRCFVDDITLWHQQHGNNLAEAIAGATTVRQWVAVAGMQINAKTVVWSSSTRAPAHQIADALGVPNAEVRGQTKDLGGDFLVALPKQCMGPAQHQRVLTGMRHMKRLRRAKLPHCLIPPLISEIRKQLKLDLHTADRCPEMVLTVLADRAALDPAFLQHYLVTTKRFASGSLGFMMERITRYSTRRGSSASTPLALESG